MPACRLSPRPPSSRGQPIVQSLASGDFTVSGASKSPSRFSISLVCLEVFWSGRAAWARTDRMRGKPTFSSAAMGLENFEHRFWMHMVCGIRIRSH
ncbi:hypothetical protein BC938DRAFT_472072 [Jimgerdemannia flammicorona]|uniref:Uncharacterized protein n=1 Tax=Jimgerdemannia flammicorona TaxID=994334 RepID=A0A433Q6T6_9FUNG|nr:hypothetical protein BC938DRAFT_472072 [Jimgerdemannia flammicorona]